MSWALCWDLLQKELNMQRHRFAIMWTAMAALSGSAMGDIYAPHGVVDWFDGAGWDLGVPPAFLAQHERGAGYNGIALGRTVLVSPDAYLASGSFPTEPGGSGVGSALTQLDAATRTMSMNTSGDGAVILSYASPAASELPQWEGFWMRYTVTTGSVQVDAWLGNTDSASPFMYHASAVLMQGTSFLYFAFEPAWNVTTAFDLQGQADLADVAGITIQFRSANGDPMAMSITGGIIPAPGAAALLGLAGLVGRRRKN